MNTANLFLMSILFSALFTKDNFIINRYYSQFKRIKFYISSIPRNKLFLLVMWVRFFSLHF